MAMLNWFEIPVDDMARARSFYEAIFAFEMHPMDMGELDMCVFPAEMPTGALIKGSMCAPSENGTMVYLNGGEDLSIVLGRVEAAGGSIVVPKTQVTEEIGYMAVFRDTEGNRVALHSPK